MEGVPFAEVLGLLESHGWKLKRISNPYRVFVHEDEPLPLLIPVYDKKVPIAYLTKIQRILEPE